MTYCDDCCMYVVHSGDDYGDYLIYLNRVQRDNEAKDMYDGDTYMGYEEELTFPEWLEYHGEA